MTEKLDAVRIVESRDRDPKTGEWGEAQLVMRKGDFEDVQRIIRAKTLREAAEVARDGQEESRISDTSGGYELGRLAKQFDKMADEVGGGLGMSKKIDRKKLLTWLRNAHSETGLKSNRAQRLMWRYKCEGESIAYYTVLFEIEQGVFDEQD